MAATTSITHDKLIRLIGTLTCPVVVDVRTDQDAADVPFLIPGSVRRPHDFVEDWGPEYAGHNVVAVCAHGGGVSAGVAAWLRATGIGAETLEGGIEAWTRAGHPTVPEASLPPRDGLGRTLWVTRARPKVDRIACPWLIRRFLDPHARILFVDPDEVVNVARESGGVPFDIKDIELSHVGERCSFDTMLRIFGLEGEPSLARLALIVRGADTARYDIAEEAAGLHAVSLGLSALAGDDDHGLLERGFIVYDALFAWLRFAAEERHNWPAKAA